MVTDGDLEADFDASQIQQALLNLVLNAIDACAPMATRSLLKAANQRKRSRYTH